MEEINFLALSDADLTQIVTINIWVAIMFLAIAGYRYWQNKFSPATGSMGAGQSRASAAVDDETGCTSQEMSTAAPQGPADGVDQQDYPGICDQCIAELEKFPMSKADLQEGYRLLAHGNYETALAWRIKHGLERQVSPDTAGMRADVGRASGAIGEAEVA